MHSRHLIVPVLLAMLVLSLTACGRARKLTLVEHGQARATIVIAANVAPDGEATSNAAVAAAEFQHYVLKMTRICVIFSTLARRI